MLDKEVYQKIFLNCNRPCMDRVARLQFVSFTKKKKKINQHYLEDDTGKQE